jgi:ribosome-associated protein
MDYVDFIVHVFSPEKRAFYGLERLRKSATTIDVATLNAELKAAIATTRAKKSPAKKAPTKAAKPASKKAPSKTPPTKKSPTKKTASKKSPTK